LPHSEGLFFDRVSRFFGGTQALRSVSLHVERGEIVALLGENGAGKSTLIKIPGGLHVADEGRVLIDGAEYTHKPGSVAAGPKVAFIHQDLGLIEWMSIAENISLAVGFAKSRGLISWRKSEQIAKQALQLVDSDFDPTTRISSLSRTPEFASRQIEHSLQATYSAQVDQDSDIYDFVIFGPSELAIQGDNIEKLAKNEDLTTFVWAFHTPLKYFETQPAGWFDFSSAYGAQKICDYMVERLGKDVTYAMNRGIPGITDNQRSGDFKDCVAEKGNWNAIYEHYGEYQREGGFEGTQLILQAYPEAKVIHNANTAMSMGSVEAQKAVAKEKEIFSTGWGGTGLELDAIRNGELDATPMRMGDDVGAATAEAIKAHLEGRAKELPLVFLGRITVAHDEMSVEEIDALEKEAFRFSGVGALDR